MAERSKKNPLESKWTLWYDDPELKVRVLSGLVYVSV